MCFKQFLLVRKQWVLPDGTAAANPKEEGIGIMLSSFCSREFGYGLPLNPSQLAIVNEFRRGKAYIDETSAVEVLNTNQKHPLTNSPFVRTFEYGVNSNGFWTYNHMVVQFEDVCDVLHALYPDKYNFVFFFDHSSGHDKLRPNGLNANAMNKSFGGEQNRMRDTVIKDSSYLGPFDHPEKLRVNDTQSMQFKEGHAGPFYLSEQKREELRYDTTTDEIEKKKYTRVELIDKLKTNYNLPNPRGTLKEIQTIATQHGLPLSFERPKI